MENIEAKVAEAILQAQKEIKVGEDVYNVAPPSLGTLILISEHISKIPEDLSFVVEEPEDVINSTLKYAKDCRFLAEIGAILILGAKNINRKKRVSKWPFSRIFERDYIADKIVNEMSPSELFNLIIGLINTLEIRDFFQLTTFLQGVNLSKPTRKVGEKKEKAKAKS